MPGRWRVRLPADIERPQVLDAGLGEVDEVPSSEPVPAPYTVDWQIRQRGIAARSIRGAWQSDDPTRRRAVRVLVAASAGAALLLIVIGFALGQ